MTSPSQVLDYMAAVSATLSDSEVQATIEGMIRSDQKVNAPSDRQFPWEDANRYIQEELRRLKMAYAYQVTSDMVDLVDYASRSLPEAVLRREEIPTDFGFVWLDKPFKSVDVHGNTMLHRLITWGPSRETSHGWPEDYEGPRTQTNIRPLPGTSGVRVNLYSDRDDPDDNYTRQLAEEFGKTTLWHKYRFQLSASIFWSWGMRHRAADDEDQHYLDTEGVDFSSLMIQPTSESSIMRRLMTFWTLCMQEVADVREAEVERHVRKRMGRAGLPGRISVVTLRRRASGASPGESQVEWHHRWIVRGHWRQQPYKDKDTGGIYTKPIWIAPYVKGPEDKPLKQAEKVYRLAR